jgi:hypothetical protein
MAVLIIGVVAGARWSSSSTRLVKPREENAPKVDVPLKPAPLRLFLL